MDPSPRDQALLTLTKQRRLGLRMKAGPAGSDVEQMSTVALKVDRAVYHSKE